MRVTPRNPGWRVTVGNILVAGLLAAQPALVHGEPDNRRPAGAKQQPPATQPAVEGRIVVARLNYRTSSASNGEVGDGETTRTTVDQPVCLSDDFLTTLARETDLPVQRHIETVALASEALLDHPFVIFTGSGSFALTSTQRDALKRYIEQGGFVLASASCSNAAWRESFEALMSDLFADKTWQTIEADHPLRHVFYDLPRIDTKKPTDTPALKGMTVANRLSVVYSPVGVNGTDNAAPGCCCCGGNEVTNARLVNVNVLLYALTH